MFGMPLVFSFYKSYSKGFLHVIMHFVAVANVTPTESRSWLLPEVVICVPVGDGCPPPQVSLYRGLKGSERGGKGGGWA